MKQLAICFLTLCLSLAVPMSVKAQSYVIGVESNDYLPYWRGEGAHYEGFARDFFDLFSAHSGNTFQFKALPVKRLTADFLDGKVDAKFPDNVYWSQDLKVGKNVLYSEPVAPFTDGVLVRPDRLGRGTASLTSLSTLIGFTPWDYLDAINAGTIKLQENTQLLAALKMVLSDRVDGTYFNPIVAQFLLKSNGLEEGSLVFDKDLPHTSSHYHLSTIKHPALLEELNRFIEERKSEIQALRSRYNIR